MIANAALYPFANIFAMLPSSDDGFTVCCAAPKWSKIQLMKAKVQS